MQLTLHFFLFFQIEQLERIKRNAKLIALEHFMFDFPLDPAKAESYTFENNARKSNEWEKPYREHYGIQEGTSEFKFNQSPKQFYEAIRGGVQEEHLDKIGRAS